MDALRPTTDPQTNSQSSAVILIVHCHWPMLQCSIAVMILSRSAQPMPYGDSYEEPLRLLPWQVRSGAYRRAFKSFCSQTCVDHYRAWLRAEVGKRKSWSDCLWLASLNVVPYAGEKSR